MLYKLSGHFSYAYALNAFLRMRAASARPSHWCCLLYTSWKEESELEKYKEVRALIEHLNIPTAFGALGASNAFQLMGILPRDKKKLLDTLDKIIENVSEEELQYYRRNLKHL